MRALLTVSVLLLGLGCVTGDKKEIRTKIVTYPDGALVQYKGKNEGRSPAWIVLPQNESGLLTERAEVHVVPNTEQAWLYPQVRVFEPDERTERVPHQVMIDMTLAGTNAIAAEVTSTTLVEKGHKKSRNQIPYVKRSKPTQAVGLDRWNPGQY